MEGRAPIQGRHRRNHGRACVSTDILSAASGASAAPRLASQKARGVHHLLLICRIQRHSCSCALILQAPVAFVLLFTAGQCWVVSPYCRPWWGCPLPPQGHWTMSINKSVAATGFEMPLEEGRCIISELEFSISLLFVRDWEKKAMSIRITDIKMRRGIPCLPR